MAMLQIGSGMGETAVTNTGTGEPTAVDKFIGGAKVWLNPSYITTEMAALWAGLKADAVGTLTNPRALGFLLVPAAVLAVVLGFKSARARRARNPRRVRRANPRRRAARRRNPAHVDAVMFRRDKESGRVIAIFPYLPATNRVGSVTVYDPVGQHGDGDLGTVISQTTPTRSPSEYAALKRELETHYDYRLRVVKKAQRRTVRPNPKRRRNAGAGSIRRTKKQYRASTMIPRGKGKGSYTAAAMRLIKRRAKGRVKNGRSYVVRGQRPYPDYVPIAGKTFYLSGRKGVVKSVDLLNRWVNFRRAVDGTTGMSLANFRQAAYI